MSAALPTEIQAAAFAVATRGVAKRYGKDFALLGVDLQVPEGAVYVLVGPNGAGKTTTLKLLLGTLKPDGGSVRVLGMDPRANGPLVRAQVGYVPERGDWGYAYMTVGRLLQHHAVLRAVSSTTTVPMGVIAAAILAGISLLVIALVWRRRWWQATRHFSGGRDSGVRGLRTE